MKKKVYHFSVSFVGFEMNYHGTCETNFKEISDIVLVAKIELAKKLELWELKGDMIKSFEIYHFDNSTENIIFGYIKDC